MLRCYPESLSDSMQHGTNKARIGEIAASETIFNEKSTTLDFDWTSRQNMRLLNYRIEL